MPSWFIFAILSLFVLAASEFSQKISLTQKINISAITNNFFIWTLQGILGLILAIFFNQNNFPLTFASGAQLLLVAIAYFIGGTLYYTSFKGNSPSLSIVLGSISILVSTTLGILFFKEGVMIQKFLGISLIILAIWTVNFRIKDKLSKYNLYALLGGVFYGIAYTVDKAFSVQASPILYVALLSFSVAFVSLFLKYKQIYNEARHFKKQHYYPMASVAVFGTLFNFFTFTAYNKGGQVGIVDAMNNSAVFIVILLEIFILKDNSNLVRKILGATMVLAGILLLARVSY